MKKTKMEKGITLIALIITIVVLLILAVVAINSITNDGLLGKAENAANKYNQSVSNEQDMLGRYEEYLNNHINGTGTGDNTGDGETDSDSGSDNTSKIVDANGNDVKNKVISTESNTEVVDAYGNKIVVPAGFKIVVNEDTNNADTVTKGIVIEDSIGNQFVWIPVGTIYTDIERTEANAKTITLGRYENFTATDGVYTPVQVAENYATVKNISRSDVDFTEDTVDNHKSDYTNAIARDIGAFITSATTRGGYYIGRYEARTNTTTEREYSNADVLTEVTSIKTNAVYNYVTQLQASSLAQGMYADGYKTDGTGTFSSDLINSYAWDTAIIFLQEFDNRADKTTPYSEQESLNTTFLHTGTVGTTTEDLICNIYDMASNLHEWSTESSTFVQHTCSRAGGVQSSGYFTAARQYQSLTNQLWRYTFRPILYLAL